MPMAARSPRAPYFKESTGSLGNSSSNRMASPSSSSPGPGLPELGPSPPRCPPWSGDATGQAVTISPAASFCLPCRIKGLLSCLCPPIAPHCVSLEEPMVEEAMAEPAGCSSPGLTVGKGLQSPP